MTRNEGNTMDQVGLSKDRYNCDAWRKVPAHIRDPIRLYVETGRPCGGFLTAVMTNDLKGALGSADDQNLAALRDIVGWLYWEAPSPCWGSAEKHKLWKADHATVPTV